MKSATKITACIMTIALLLCSLTSCIEGDRARETIEDFFSAMEEGNYDTAASCLHPDKPVDLQDFADKVEEGEAVDLGSGIEILRYTSVSSAYYDSTVDGALYETTCQAKIGERDVLITVQIVENDAGYGIYHFSIDF